MLSCTSVWEGEGPLDVLAAGPWGGEGTRRDTRNTCQNRRLAGVLEAEQVLSRRNREGSPPSPSWRDTCVADVSPPLHTQLCLLLQNSAPTQTPLAGQRIKPRCHSHVLENHVEVRRVDGSWVCRQHGVHIRNTGASRRRTSIHATARCTQI